MALHVDALAQAQGLLLTERAHTHTSDIPLAPGTAAHLQLRLPSVLPSPLPPGWHFFCSVCSFVDRTSVSQTQRLSGFYFVVEEGQAVQSTTGLLGPGGRQPSLCSGPSFICASL